MKEVATLWCCGPAEGVVSEPSDEGGSRLDQERRLTATTIGRRNIETSKRLELVAELATAGVKEK